MRLAARLFMLVLGLAFAIPVGGLVLFVGAVTDPVAQELLARWSVALLEAIFAEAELGGEPAQVAGLVAAGLGTLSMALVVAPPVFTALAGEVVGTRSFAWYGAICGIVTAILPWLLRSRGTIAGLAGVEGRLTALLFIAGAAAGLTYWLIAGRSAGRAPEREALPPPWPGAAPPPRG